MAAIPDPVLVDTLTALHIDNPEQVAEILGRHGLTICAADHECNEPSD